MRYGKVIVCLFTAVFLAAAVYIKTLEPEPNPLQSFSVNIPSGGETEKIDCWENTMGECFLFLPSYAELSKVSFCLERNASVSIDGQPVRDGDTCAGLGLDVPYSFTYGSGSGYRETTLTFVRSGNVPAIYIDVLSGSMDYIHGAKGNQESGQTRLYGADGDLIYTGRIDSISGRGNSTWELDKKPYSLRLSEEADLLGMGEAQNWILLANALDTSNLRNKIVYDFAGEIGMAYSPQCRWVDLYLNGEYAGLYLLTTRNEMHPRRVAISGDSGFLVSMELEYRLREQHIPYVRTGFSDDTAYRIHDSALGTDSLETMLRSMENAILAADGVDPATGKHYLELIDLDSWVCRYLIDEVFGNLDGGFISEFFYYDPASGSEKIFAGPVWDMDNCLSMRENVSYSIWAGRPHTRLFYALWQKTEFRQRIRQLYAQVFRPTADQLLESEIGEYRDQILLAGRMNALRWETGDLSQQAESIRGYLEARMAFLDDYFLGAKDYCVLEVADPDGMWYGYGVPRGELAPDLGYADNELGRFLGYYTSDTGDPFGLDKPMYSDITIYPKWEAFEEEDGHAFFSIPVYTLLPLAALIGILMILLLTDWIRTRRNGSGKSGNTGACEVSSRTEI